MEWVETYPQVKSIFTHRLHHVLVSTNATCLQCLGWQLFPFIWDKMDAQRELIYTSPLSPQVEDSDLRICKETRLEFTRRLLLITTYGNKPIINNAIVGYKCHLRLPTTVNSTVKRRNHIYRLVMSHTDIAYYNSKARFR